MEINVYYSPEYEEVPGAVVRYTTPFLGVGKAQAHRVRFAPDADTGCWGLSVEVYEEDMGTRFWRGLPGVPFRREERDLGEYIAWLERNVLVIEVDARTIWHAPDVLEAPEDIMDGLSLR